MNKKPIVVRHPLECGGKRNATPLRACRTLPAARATVPSSLRSAGAFQIALLLLAALPAGAADTRTSSASSPVKVANPVKEGELTFPGEHMRPPNALEFYLLGKLENYWTHDDPSLLSNHEFAPASPTTINEDGGMEGQFGQVLPR